MHEVLLLGFEFKKELLNAVFFFFFSRHLFPDRGNRVGVARTSGKKQI